MSEVRDTPSSCAHQGTDGYMLIPCVVALGYAVA